MTDVLYTVASGDLRHDANVICWPTQAKLEADFATAVEALGWSVRRGHPVGEHGNRAVALVQGVEPFVEVVREDLGDRLGAPVRIERRRLAEVADLEDAALLLGVRGEGRGQDEREQREDEKPSHRLPPAGVGMSGDTLIPDAAAMGYLPRYVTANRVIARARNRVT